YDNQGRGPRVYVCNGGPANDHRYLADDLVPLHDDFAFVFHDYRGSGRSATAPDETYRIARLAADLDELRAEIGDEQITILGHSMGGFVAQSYALQFPARCAALILAGTFPSAAPQKMLPQVFRAMGVLRTTKMASRALWWVAAWSWR